MLIPGKNIIPAVTQSAEIYHLTENELNRLPGQFQQWFEKKRSSVGARYWLVFLFPRYTEARITEVLQINESRAMPKSRYT